MWHFSSFVAIGAYGPRPESVPRPGGISGKGFGSVPGIPGRLGWAGNPGKPWNKGEKKGPFLAPNYYSKFRIWIIYRQSFEIMRPRRQRFNNFEHFPGIPGIKGWGIECEEAIWGGICCEWWIGFILPSIGFWRFGKERSPSPGWLKPLWPIPGFCRGGACCWPVKSSNLSNDRKTNRFWNF